MPAKPETVAEREAPSAARPGLRLRIAYSVIFLVGAWSIAVGLTAEFGEVPFLRERGFGIDSSLLGIAFLVCGVLVRKGVLAGPALALAAGMYVLDAVLALPRQAAGADTAGAAVLVGAVGFRLVVLVLMLQGFGALPRGGGRNR
jgi:hypothetical protein